MFSAEVIQKLIFFIIFFLSGISAYKLCPEEWGIGRYFAGFLYMINPFVYVRFLAGHWLLLLAYAVTPFVIKGFMDFFASPSTKRAVYVAFLLTFVFALETHTPFLLLIVFGIFFLMAVIEARKKIDLSKYAALVLLFLLILNSYWLVPSFSGSSAPLGEITNSDLYTFTTRQDINFNTLFTTASMYGFWRVGYIYAKDLLPYWYIFFIFILFLAVHGFTSNYKHPARGVYVKAFGALAVLAAILATGISGPFERIFEFLFNNVFFFKGFREPQKFEALLVLAYAYLGGLGVAEIARYKGSAGTSKKIGAWIIIAIAIATPFIYSFTMFNGFWGQLKPADYPEDWYEVNDFLNLDKQDFNVLFLPWHLYMDFKWLPTPQKRLANPAQVFFDKPVIQGDNMEAGVYSSSMSPVSGYIQNLLQNKDGLSNFGKFMVPLNVKYIILTKEVDFKQYFFLFNQTDLVLKKETDNFYIFENKHTVSRFYQADKIDQQNSTDLKPISYTQASPVKFHEEAGEGYIVFVPPNMDSDYWELEGRTSMVNGSYAVYHAEMGTIYYRRFDTFLFGYIVSLLTFIGLVVWYKKETLQRMLERNGRR
ncbi:MAG: hypothetical protein O8C66_09020 [Candidatus Methanoperedens sp.]|nr:hypothetical protein [Candidatus Methanoperedens sp.]